ncbi:hypothetical protein OA848_05170 [Rickettsiales bacterium]|nr:hypothetical protein [Rickettsiales bacterium]
MIYKNKKVVFALGMITAFLIQLFIIVILFVFFVKSENTKTFYRLYSSLPNYLVQAYFSDSLEVEGSILESINLLNKQKKISTVLGMNDIMKDLIVKNTFIVFLNLDNGFNHTNNPNEVKKNYKLMFDFLIELQKVFGNYYKNFWIDYMVAHSKFYLNPETEIESLKVNIQDFPALPDGYREIIDYAIRTKNIKLLKNTCKNYNNQSFPALNYKTPLNNKKVETIFNNNILLSLMTDTEKEVKIKNLGVMSGDWKIFEFKTDSLVPNNRLVLNYDLIPGVMISIESISFKDKTIKKKYNIDDLIISSKNSYFINKNTLIKIVERDDKIIITPKNKSFPKSQIIRIKMKFEKLPLTNHPLCLF